MIEIAGIININIKLRARISLFSQRFISRLKSFAARNLHHSLQTNVFNITRFSVLFCILIASFQLKEILYQIFQIMKTMTPNDQRNLFSQENVTNVTRRNFISSCSACAACAALAPMSFINTSCSSGSADKKMKIRVLYSLHAPVQAQPDWPNIGFDFNP